MNLPLEIQCILWETSLRNSYPSKGEQIGTKERRKEKKVRRIVGVPSAEKQYYKMTEIGFTEISGTWHLNLDIHYILPMAEWYYPGNEAA